MKKKKILEPELISDTEEKKRLEKELKHIPLDDLDSYEGTLVKNPYLNETISTGSVIFDIYLDGGFACGVSRFIGEAEHGKTANALAWGKNWLETVKNSRVWYINAEGRLTKRLVDRSGINTDPSRLYIWTHNIFEDIAETISHIIYNNPKKYRYFFVIDSLDNVITRDDFQKKMGDAKTVAGGARMGSFFLKKTCLRIAGRGHHFMALSQTRMNMNSKKVGQTSTTASGGKAITFGSSLTGEIQKIYGGQLGTLIYEDRNNPKSTPIGHYFTVRFDKTYHERTHQKISIPIKYGHGVWHEMECLDLCRAYEYIVRSGAGWYEFSDVMVKLVKDNGQTLPKKLQGEYKVIDFLESNQKITWIILNYIKKICISKKVALSELDIENDGDLLNSKED